MHKQFAKGVTCGYVQLGGVVVSKEIAAYFDDHVFSCGLTYNGHPLVCAAGVACVQYYLDHDIPGHVREVGKVLGDILEESIPVSEMFVTSDCSPVSSW